MVHITKEADIVDKGAMYEFLLQQLTALTEDEDHLIPNLANASALLNMTLADLNWVGFYTVEDGYLLLGPFQGKPACIRIATSRGGVCMAAVKEDKTMIVPDVHQFPGHIACDSASNSEIVVPIHYKGKVVAVLDIDSPLLNRFDEEDGRGLEKMVKILEQACCW